ncbi:MAG: hypothetical protein ABWY18_09225 [Tardiphaga sp.]
MKLTTVLALAVAATTITVPAAAYYLSVPSDDALGDSLRGYGFIPVTPPSTLMPVGSLYYVDSKVRDFRAICHADRSDLDESVTTSRSLEMQETLERNGKLATGVNIDLGWLLNGNVDNSYVVKVRSSLTDVNLQEIPLGSNELIFTKLMKKPQCSEIVMRYIHAGFYVCQGQKILNATAEYKLDRDAQNKLSASAKATADDIKDIVKRAVETQGEQSVVDKEGRLLAGKALTYGVLMAPLCIAPTTGHFKRTLPQSTFGRITNYVLFNIVEPLLPASPELPQVVEAAGDEVAAK